MAAPDSISLKKTDLSNDTFSAQQFGQANFDPVQFLNDTLPPLNLSSLPQGQGQNAPVSQLSSKQPRTALLQAASAQVQTTLARLSAHNIQSSSELTTLADEILRSGNRLAYEVEVLRGDVNGFWEVLTDGLRDEIARFVFKEVAVVVQGEGDDEALRISSKQQEADPTAMTVMGEGSSSVKDNEKEPDFIRQLRELGTVKARLEAVINVFGEALKWPIPPSDVSVASSLISVSAPELGVANSAEDDKAREYTRQLRNEITAILDSEGGGTMGLDAATKKILELRTLARIWKGTGEEKARTRVVDSLARVVEDRKRLLDARAAATARSATDENVSRSSSSGPGGRANRIVEGSTNTAAGLFRNLQKLRDEIYQD